MRDGLGGHVVVTNPSRHGGGGTDGVYCTEVDATDIPYRALRSLRYDIQKEGNS